MSIFGIPNGMIVPPGSTLDIGPSRPNMGYVAPPNDSMGFQLPPMESTTTEFPANQVITHSYPLIPYADKTHEYIQPQMLTFVSKHLDPKYKVFNMVPIFSLNIMQNMAWKEFMNSAHPKNIQFKAYLAKYGEKILEEYHLNRQNIQKNAELEAYYTLAKSADFKYLTRFGIIQSWNFAGAVISKGESTGPAAYMDRHSQTDIVYVAALATGKRARVSNIWCKARPGDRLCVILTRKDKDGPLVWIPYNHGDREYPTRSYSTYYDLSGRICESFVRNVGLVTEAVERDTTINQTDMALGYFNDNSKDAYEAYGTLSTLIVQIRI
jgi:hypothetical protein